MTVQAGLTRILTRHAQDPETGAALILHQYVVIPRKALPAVETTPSGHSYRIAGRLLPDLGGGHRAADAARTAGLRWLALADHLDTHPPGGAR